MSKQMRTLPREPWQGGQICGEQLEYGVVPGRSVYCGEFKKFGSPLCETHDREERLDNYGALPKFAEGNALGRGCGPYVLMWEPHAGIIPVPPTADELAEFQAQLKEDNA